MGGSSELVKALQILQVVVYSGLFVIALVNWRRRPGQASAWLVATFGPLFMWFVSSRIPIARLEADSWGIRCTTPLTTVRIPWSDLRSLEVRGRSASTQRVVAVTKQGRERILRVWDPRLPVTRDVARTLVAELEAVWRSTTTPRGKGME